MPLRAIGKEHVDVEADLGIALSLGLEAGHGAAGAERELVLARPSRGRRALGRDARRPLRSESLEPNAALARDTGLALEHDSEPADATPGSLDGRRPGCPVRCSRGRGNQQGQTSAATPVRFGRERSPTGGRVTFRYHLSGHEGSARLLAQMSCKQAPTPPRHSPRRRLPARPAGRARGLALPRRRPGRHARGATRRGRALAGRARGVRAASDRDSARAGVAAGRCDRLRVHEPAQPYRPSSVRWPSIRISGDAGSGRRRSASWRALSSASSVTTASKPASTASTSAGWPWSRAPASSARASSAGPTGPHGEWVDAVEFGLLADELGPDS